MAWVSRCSALWMTSVIPQVARVARECHSKPSPNTIHAMQYNAKIAKAAGCAESTPSSVSHRRTISKDIPGNAADKPAVPNPAARGFDDRKAKEVLAVVWPRPHGGSLG